MAVIGNPCCPLPKRWRDNHLNLKHVYFVLTTPSKTLYSYTVHKLEIDMAIQTTYTQARASLASLMDEVTKNREVVIIQRRGREDVAMITADELAGVLETAHLLRSPKNAKRLLTALDRVKKGSGTSQTIDDLRNEIGFE